MTCSEYDIEGMPLRMLFVRYLMASYLYYEAHRPPPWSDHHFDLACRRLLREWDDLDHHHKGLTNPESLRAGTGYSIKYPTITKHSAYGWLEEVGPWFQTS